MVFKVIVAVAIGAAVGGIALCAITLVFHLLLRIPELSDGQYPLMFFGKLLSGGLLGAATAGWLIYLVNDRWNTGAVILAVCGITVLLLCFTAFVPGQYGGRLRNLLVYTGPELLWSVSLIALALRGDYWR